MAEKKAIIPIKDLVELHERAKFPLDMIYLTFKDYDWLAKFLNSCFEQLYAAKKIKYREKFYPDRKYPRGLKALDKFVSKKLGYKKLVISIYLKKKHGFPLLWIAFLARECGRKLEEIQPQILDMHLGHNTKFISLNVLYILHNSKTALAPHQVNRILEREFGIVLLGGRISDILNSLYHTSYLVKHYIGGASFYTLRGEERKYKLK